MRWFTFLWIVLFLCPMAWSSPASRILIFGRTIRSAHADIIPVAGRALVDSLAKLKIQSELIVEPADLERAKFSDFSAIVLLDLSEGVLSEASKLAIEQFAEQGGGIVALHASIGAGRDWPWLQNLFGVKFLNHPPIQKGRILIVDSGHIFDREPLKSWSQLDEWYNFSGTIQPESAVVMKVELPSPGASPPTLLPIAWTRSVGKGKFIYLAAGHAAELFQETEGPYVRSVLSAIQWASAGDH